jgi:hypothetical protein
MTSPNNLVFCGGRGLGEAAFCIALFLLFYAELKLQQLR